VRRFGGFVAKYMGDGVLVYFGYPEAHEDDAE
jgi:class 3 adenylate cyclase